MYRDRVTDTDVAHTGVERPPWSPAQLVALAIGIFFLVLGGVTLARTGIHSNSFGSDPLHVTVWGFHQTALMGVIELVFGLLMLGAGVIPGAGRGTMTFLGIVALGFGIVLLIQPSSFTKTLGAPNGWLFVIPGALSLLAAMVSPIFFGGGRTVASGRTESVAGGGVRREREIIED